MIWIEVLDRRGHAAHRVRGDRLPLTIGRAWDNDVVVDDPHVDPRHARVVLDESGTVVLEDLGSVNGIVREGTRSREDRLEVRGVTTVRVGHTALRIARGDAPVPPAVPVQGPAGGPAALIASPRRAAASIAAGMLVAAASLWLDETTARAGTRALGGLVAVATVTLLWSGAWALAGRANVQRGSFLQHLAATWLTVLAFDISRTATGWLGFLLAADRLASALSVLIWLVLGAALLATQLGLATQLPRERRLVTAAAVTLALAGAIVLMSEAAVDEFGGGNVAIEGAIKPLPAGLVRATSVDAFLERAEGLKSSVDRLAED